MKSVKEIFQENKLPLSEEMYYKLKHSSPKEINQLPKELLIKFSETQGIIREKQGYLDWE